MTTARIIEVKRLGPPRKTGDSHGAPQGPHPSDAGAPVSERRLNARGRKGFDELSRVAPADDESDTETGGTDREASRAKVVLELVREGGRGKLSRDPAGNEGWPPEGLARHRGGSQLGESGVEVFVLEETVHEISEPEIGASGTVASAFWGLLCKPIASWGGDVERGVFVVEVMLATTRNNRGWGGGERSLVPLRAGRAHPLKIFAGASAGLLGAR